MKPCLIYFPSVLFLVSTLKEQLEDMRKISQNSQASNDKIVQLQNQVNNRLIHTQTHSVWTSGGQCITLNFPFWSSLFRLTDGRGQRPPARGVGHSGETEEEPHGDGQVNEPVGELESRAAGEVPCSGRGEGPAGEGTPATSEQPGIREKELQPGL